MMTMDEAVTCTKRLKEERMLQENFVEEVGLSSWEEAVMTLPQCARHLDLYRGRSKDKEIFTTGIL